MRKKYCFILNYAPHYRAEILQAISNEFDGDFYIGNKTYTDIKKVDYQNFKNFKKELIFKKLSNNFYFLKGQLSLAFKSYSIYIITGQTYNISGWVLLVINKILGKKIYLWNHGLYGHENKVQSILKKLQFNLSSGYFLYGNYAKDLMIDNGYRKDKLHVIYNSLQYSKQLKIRNKLHKTSVFADHFKNEYPTVIFIGRLTKVKKLDMLLEAMKLCFDEKTYFNIAFVGDGEQKIELEQKTVLYGIKPHCWFYGSLYEEDTIGEFLYNATVCISPGNVGLTAIHALTYGCPVITHDNFSKQGPEFEVIEEGKTGAFFKYDNNISLKEVIQKWLLEQPQKSEYCINACHEKIDTNYTPQNQLRILKEVLK